MRHTFFYRKGFIAEARLCHMDGSQGRGPDAPEPKAETKTEAKGEVQNQPKPIEAQKIPDSAQDNTKVRTDLAMNQYQDIGAKINKIGDQTGVAIDVVKTKSATLDFGGAKKQEAVKDSKPKLQGEEQEQFPANPNVSPTGTDSFTDARRGVTPADSIPPEPAAADTSKTADAPKNDPINTPKPNVIKPEPSFAPSATAKEDPKLVQDPGVPPAPDAASTPDAKGAAGNDKVSGGEPSPATPDKSLPATPGDKGKDVPQPATPEAQNAAPPATSEQAPAGAPEGVKKLQELRSKAAEIVGKMGEINSKIATANGEIQQLKQKQNAPDATQEQKDALQTKIDDLTKTVESLKNDLKTLKEESKGITDQLKEAKGELPKDASSADVAKRSLDDMGDTFRDPNATGGEKLIAAIQAIGAVMALWREATGQGKASVDTASDKPSDKKKDGDPTKPADGKNKSPEGPETKDGRRTRLRQELKDPQVKSVDDLIKNKSDQLNKTLDENQKEFGKTNENVKKILDQSKNNLDQRDGLINQLRDRNLTPEQRTQISQKITTLETEHKQLMSDADKGNDKLKSINKVMSKSLDDFDADKAELREMQKEVQSVKEGMDTIMNQLKELKNPGVDKLLTGVTVGIDEKTLTLTVTATASAQEELKTIAPEMKFDSTGKLEGDPKQFAEALVKLLNKMKDQPQSPAGTPSGDAPPAGAPTSPDTSADIKGEMGKVFAGTLADTLNVLSGPPDGGRIGLAKRTLDGAQKELAEVNSSWNPFRTVELVGGKEQGNKERAVKMAESVLKVLQTALEQVKAIPTDDPQKHMKALMDIRCSKELGLPKVSQEFAKDYDAFQKMVSDGVDKKDKSGEMDYAALNKELQEIDATLANVEMTLNAIDIAASTAASAVPFGSDVYRYSQAATNVLSGNKTPQQAGVDLATSMVFGKLGGKVLASAGGKKLIETYAKKFADKFFSNADTLKKFVAATTKMASSATLKAFDAISGIRKTVSGLANAGIDKASAYWNSDIQPALEKLGAKGQEALGQCAIALKEVGDGAQIIYAQIQKEGFKGAGDQYKQEFNTMYGPALAKAEAALTQAGVPKDKIAAFRAGVEQQFDQGIQTLNDVRDKGVGTVLKDFGSDLGVVGKGAYDQYLKSDIDKVTDAGKQYLDQGIQALKEIKTGVMTSTAMDFGKGYKEQFAKMYGPKVDQAKDLLVKAGLDKGKVDQFVGDVTAGIEKGFDKGVQTVQNINDKGAGSVLKGFVADLGVVGGDAYEKYLAPSVGNVKEGGRQMLANGMQMLNEIKTGVMTSTAMDFGKGYKEQFAKMYGPKVDQAKDLLVKAGLDKGKVDQFVGDVSAGIEKQFDAGVKTATEIQQKGVATVLREFSSDMGIVAEKGFNDYIKPLVDKMDAKARPHVEIAMRELATLKEGAVQLIAQDPKQTAEEYAQRLQKAYGPAIEAARTELAQAGITPDNAKRFLDATVQSAKDGYKKVAARVQKG